MIDVTSEQLLTLSEATRLLPGRVHVSTVHRWRLRGVQGIHLETAVVGGRRYTSREALARFSEAVTAARDGISISIRSPAARERAVIRAERELEAAGI
jgi:hypothetical protein